MSSTTLQLDMTWGWNKTVVRSTSVCRH